MSSAGQEKLSQAMADIDRAHIVIAGERRSQLETKLREAIETAGQIAKRIKELGADQAVRNREFADVWNERDAVRVEMRGLTSQEFFLPEEIAAAEKRLGTLDEQYSKLTKRIAEITSLNSDHQILNLQFDEQRLKLAIHDLRVALKGGLQEPMIGGPIRTSAM
jgi:chromosome segregation ATPase